MQLVFYLTIFSTPCMGYLLYLMFRCDRRCDGCDGKFGNFVGTKHTPRRGIVKHCDDRGVSLVSLAGPPMSSTARAVQLTSRSLTKGKPSGNNAAPAPHFMTESDSISIVLGADKKKKNLQRAKACREEHLIGSASTGNSS